MTTPLEPQAGAREAALREALEKARQDINWMLNNREFMSPFVFDYIDRALASPLLKEAPADERTGWGPGMLQDDSRELSRALANAPHARLHAKEAALQVMSDESQPQSLGASPAATALSAPAPAGRPLQSHGAGIEQLRRYAAGALGEEWAAMLDDGVLASCYGDAIDSGITLFAEDVTIARAAIHVATGSALLSGKSKKAIKDATALYGLLCRANNLLIGSPAYCARDQARSAETIGLGPQGEEPGPAGSRPEQTGSTA
jgi:hypothetical protein